MEIAIAVHSSKAVKPSNNGGSNSSCDTPAADIIPLSVFDELHNEYMSAIHAFHPPAPPAAALEAGLSTALAEYREWAGRLVADPSTGRRAILLNNAGVRLVEATAGVALDAVMPLLLRRPAARRLCPAAGGGELMLIQVTKFACGSLVVGHAAHHAVGDGFAVCQFLLAWGQSTRGVAVDPVPVHDRVSSFVPRDPPRIEFDHRRAEFQARDAGSGNDDDAGDDVVVTHRVHFSAAFISELVSMASAGAPRPHTTTRCVAAHLWRCVTMARGLGAGAGGDGEETTVTRLHIAVNGRARITAPDVPEGYAGNVVLWAHPAAAAGELVASPLGHAAEVIRRKVARAGDAYFRSFVDFASSGAVEEERLEPIAGAPRGSPDLEVYCLRRVPFYGLDFGGGRQFFFMPCYSPVDGAVYILPPAPHGDGGVEVQVSLFSRAMDAFKDCCYSL